MTAKTNNLGIIHKILLLFVVLNIIGDIGNVAFWWANVDSRAASLNTGYIATVAGVNNALYAGTIILTIVAVIYIVALFGLTKKTTWAPMLIIAISVVNRILALILYFISPAFAFWAAWTVILFVVAYLDWTKIKNLPKST